MHAPKIDITIVQVELIQNTHIEQKVCAMNSLGCILHDYRTTVLLHPATYAICDSPQCCVMTDHTFHKGLEDKLKPNCYSFCPRPKVYMSGYSVRTCVQPYGRYVTFPIVGIVGIDVYNTTTALQPSRCQNLL